ncbi:hypothetical protein DPMN_087280 [Dreissena polymorpha]|uniref:EGF-like domain-containing protein n=1 Tax=Dreissena polymorpha TaxID=45954 RepID=A0A9D4QVC2_DREPO|nr:hypothetical protein DPMN_087280 [Dreissena polymorpha]
MFVHVIVESCIVTSVLVGCTPNPCLQGGTCTDAVYSEDFVCKCAPGWDGPICSKRKSLTFFHVALSFGARRLRSGNVV